MIAKRKLIEILIKYEKGATEQMINKKLKETESISSKESIENFELVGAMAQFMTVRDIANELGVLKELQQITLK